jgi:hypothetical protein
VEELKELNRKKQEERIEKIRKYFFEATGKQMPEPLHQASL